MRKHLGLLFVLMGISGVASLLLGFTIGIRIFVVIGFVFLLLSALAGLVSNALSTDMQDPTSWTYKPKEGLQLPTEDKSQLSMGGYTPGPR
jgi:TM2 domain-containing membrane protein YozV